MIDKQYHAGVYSLNGYMIAVNRASIATNHDDIYAFANDSGTWVCYGTGSNFRVVDSRSDAVEMIESWIRAEKGG